MPTESELYENLNLPSDDQRNALAKKAAEMVMLEDEIEKIEKELKKKKDELTQLSTKDMPELMAQCGVAAFKMQSGVELISDNFMSGSLPKEPTLRAIAMDFLSNNDGASLIKDTFTVELKKGDHEKAEAIASFLRDKKALFDRKMDVHAGSLKKYAKERLKKGMDMPLDKLGLYSGRYVKVVRPKEDGGL